MNMGSNDKHQVTKNHHLFQAMGHAFDGIVAMLKEERNMRFHVLAAMLAVIVGWYLKISTEDWLWILLVVFLVTMISTSRRPRTWRPAGFSWRPSLQWRWA